MAMRHPRLTVFAGAMISLAAMHVMSAFFGYATTVIPRVYTYYLSSFLFAIFGIKMLRDGYYMSPNEGQVSALKVTPEFYHLFHNSALKRTFNIEFLFVDKHLLSFSNLFLNRVSTVHADLNNF